MLNKISLRRIKSFLSLRGAKRRGNLSGFSLIELMVAVVILAMAIFGIFQAYSVGFMGMVDARDVTVATNYAREEMENLKNISFDSLDNTDSPEFFIIPNQTKFSGTKNIENSNGNADLKKVTITVSWEDKEVELVTLIYDLK